MVEQRIVARLRGSLSVIFLILWVQSNREDQTSDVCPYKYWEIIFWLGQAGKRRHMASLAPTPRGDGRRRKIRVAYSGDLKEPRPGRILPRPARFLLRSPGW